LSSIGGFTALDDKGRVFQWGEHWRPPIPHVTELDDKNIMQIYGDEHWGVFGLSGYAENCYFAKNIL
jgi:hypothetical protein